MFGFEATEEDVETVLKREWHRVGNTNGASFEMMAEQLLGDLNCGAIEKAALKHSCELDEQTNAALEEIDRQLVGLGVLRPRDTQPHGTATRQEQQP